MPVHILEESGAEHFGNFEGNTQSPSPSDRSLVIRVHPRPSVAHSISLPRANNSPQNGMERFGHGWTRMHADSIVQLILGHYNRSGNCCRCGRRTLPRHRWLRLYRRCRQSRCQPRDWAADVARGEPHGYASRNRNGSEVIDVVVVVVQPAGKERLTRGECSQSRQTSPDPA